MLTTAVHAEVPTATLRSMIYAYPTLHRARARRRCKDLGPSDGSSRHQSAAGASRSSSYAGRQASATAASWASSSTCAGAPGSKPVERATASYQCGAQTPSESRRPGGPVQHPVGELDAEPVAQPAQVRLGVAQEVAGVDHRGARPAARRAAAPAGAGRCRRARTPRASGRRRRPPRPGRGSAARCGTRRPSPAPCRRQQVVGHVLGVVHRRRVVGPSSAGPPRRRRSAARRSPRRGRGGRARCARGTRRRTARRPRRCPAGSPRRASSRWRCCAARTTSRRGRSRGRPSSVAATSAATCRW